MSYYSSIICVTYYNRVTVQPFIIAMQASPSEMTICTSLHANMEVDNAQAIVHTVTIGSLIVQIYSQVADLGSACKLAPQSPGLPQTERLSMRVLKLILKLREVSPLVWELYTVSRKGQVTKHK